MTYLCILHKDLQLNQVYKNKLMPSLGHIMHLVHKDLECKGLLVVYILVLC